MSDTKQANEAPILVKIRQDGLATILMDRADIHNAFDDKLIKLLTDSINKLEQDERVRAILLTASGKSFSAGADLNWMKRMAGYSWEQNYQDSLQLAGLMQALYSCSKPTIAQVQGAAFGGGVGLVACCDIAIASDKALFCLSEVKLGLIPAVISPYVVKAMGERNAKRYFVTAERFDAQQAQSMGLVHQVVAADQLENTSQTLIKNLLANSPAAVFQAKKLIESVADKSIDEELIRDTAQRIADIRASLEGKEGVSAFLEKRPADWFNLKSEEV